MLNRWQPPWGGGQEKKLHRKGDAWKMNDVCWAATLAGLLARREHQNKGPEAWNSLTFQEAVSGLVWLVHNIGKRKNVLVCGMHTDIILAGDSLIALHVCLVIWRRWLCPWGWGLLSGPLLGGRTRLDILDMCCLSDSGFSHWHSESWVGWQGKFWSRVFPDPEGLQPTHSQNCLLQARDRLQFEALPDPTSQW